MILQEAEAACDSILYYNLTVKHGEKTLSHDHYLEVEGGTREKVLEDLDPYTNYMYYYYITTVLLLYCYCITTILLYCITTILLLLYYYYCITNVSLLYSHCINTV